MSNIAELMKKELKSIGTRITVLKKQHRELEKDNKPRFALTEKIERLEKQKGFYQVSKTDPVRFDNEVVVNAKLIKAYVKKLPRSATVTYSLNSDSLTVKWDTFREGRGAFVFMDLSDWYEGFALPSAEEVLFNG
ncbi:hypothetical protein DHX103_14330 [Planococcus sp. X10-3]|uniref:hypothetical protein n=1 Tax=Planococcus sp. X10-3 TaxID=3061240 RepID=UPI003BB04662